MEKLLLRIRKVFLRGTNLITILFFICQGRLILSGKLKDLEKLFFVDYTWILSTSMWRVIFSGERFSLGISFKHLLRNRVLPIPQLVHLSTPFLANANLHEFGLGLRQNLWIGNYFWKALFCGWDWQNESLFLWTRLGFGQLRGGKN